MGSVIVPNVGWWITGALQTQPETLLYVFESGSWTSGPEVAEKHWLHCMVQYDAIKTLIMSGRGFSKSIQIYNWEDQSWIQGPDMIDYRFNYACGIDPISNLVVIAGGQISFGPDYSLKSVELVDMESLKIEKGPDLPKPISLGSIATNATSLFLSGGWTVGSYDSIGDIYMFRSNGWIKLDQTIPGGAMDHYSMFVTDEFLSKYKC